MKALRFGDIPENCKSKIWHIDECVGEEIGVSCWEIKDDCVLIPLNQKAFTDFQGEYTYSNMPMYVIEGDCIGKGSDGEPLLANITSCKELIFK